jgi:hypothetical protein
VFELDYFLGLIALKIHNFLPQSGNFQFESFVLSDDFLIIELNIKMRLFGLKFQLFDKLLVGFFFIFI